MQGLPKKCVWVKQEVLTSSLHYMQINMQELPPPKKNVCGSNRKYIKHKIQNKK